MIINALAEVVTLGAVLPFLGVLISPEKILENKFVFIFANYFNLKEPSQLSLAITIVFASAAMIAGGIRIFLLWFNTKLAFASGADLSEEVYLRNLCQPYSVHISRNSSEVISGIIDKVNSIIFWIMVPALSMISLLLFMVFMITTLIFINPFVATIAFFGFGSSYLFITWFSKKKLRENSILIAREQSQVIKALQEGLGGIRDVLLDSSQKFYCNIYRKADRPLRSAYGSNIFIAGCPRFAMEAIGMSMIAVFAYSLSKNGNISTALPTLGALALGAQRLLPALQQIYSGWQSINGSLVSLEEVITLLDQPIAENILEENRAPLPFKEKIELRNVSFKFTPDSPYVLKNINLTIPKGSRVGFVGSTGCGKSTTLDILMGLLTPTEGSLFIDDVKVEDRKVPNWQKNIAHVPQSIYLADSSLKENIAFSKLLEEINIEDVKHAARQAHIAEFIDARGKGYNETIGEQGIQLSGGQRQRVGIARALYKKSEVLILDEATSALDNTTEEAVMKSIDRLNKNMTILIIAHRLSTIKKCDYIVVLDNGKIENVGDYHQLIEKSPSFGAMVSSMDGK